MFLGLVGVACVHANAAWFHRSMRRHVPGAVQSGPVYRLADGGGGGGGGYEGQIWGACKRGHGHRVNGCVVLRGSDSYPHDGPSHNSILAPESGGGEILLGIWSMCLGPYGELYERAIADVSIDRQCPDSHGHHRCDIWNHGLLANRSSERNHAGCEIPRHTLGSSL